MARKQYQETDSKLIELLSLAEKKEEAEEVVLLQDDLFSFLQTFNIRSGEQLVRKAVLQALYMAWSKNPLTKTQLSLKLSHYLQDHVKGSKQYYKVNLDAFELNKKLLLYIEKNKTDKTKTASWRKHFEDFLNSYKIEAGKKWIQGSILKHLYDKWSFNNKRKILLSDVQLHAFLRLYFKHKRNGISRMDWFAVNEDFIKNHVTAAMVQTLTKKKKKPNEKKQKTKSKISSPSS